MSQKTEMMLLVASIKSNGLTYPKLAELQNHVDFNQNGGDKSLSEDEWYYFRDFASAAEKYLHMTNIRLENYRKPKSNFAPEDDCPF